MKLKLQDYASIAEIIGAIAIIPNEIIIWSSQSYVSGERARKICVDIVILY